MPRVRFGPFAPDAAEFDTGASAKTSNVLSAGVGGARHFRPAQALSAYSSNALDGKGLGLIGVRQADGDTVIFAGDATKLYQLDSTDLGFDDVSKVGNYTVTSGDYWQFIFWSTNKVIGVADSETPQIFTLGSSSIFADLSGTPPTAAHVAVIGPHIMLGKLGSDPRAVQWSKAADETVWTTGGGSTAGGTQNFDEGGHVHGITNGRLYGYLFQEERIRRVQYTRDSSHFQFDIVARDIGLIAPRSLVSYGESHFFLARDGFYQFNGQTFTPIGRGRVDRTFYDNVDGVAVYQTYAGIDPEDNKVYWAYYTDLGTYARSVLWYDFYHDEWGEIEDWEVSVLANILPLGVTLENLDTLYSSFNLDTLPLSLDSRAFQGGLPALAALDGDNKLAFPNGANLAATVDTGEAEVFEGRRSIVVNTRPLVDTTAAQVAIGSRVRLGDSVSYNAATSQETNGDCPQRADNRYHRARVTIPAGEAWTEAQGVDFEAVDGGLI